MLIFLKLTRNILLLVRDQGYREMYFAPIMTRMFPQKISLEKVACTWQVVHWYIKKKLGVMTIRNIAKNVMWEITHYRSCVQ